MSTYITYKLDGVVRKVPCKSVLTLGRDMNSDIVLPDLHASRNHAMIRCIGNGDYYLIDSGSSNGSFVNRQRVAMPKLLKNGDRITIGRFEILFEQSSKEAGSFDKMSMQDTVISDSPDIKQITVLVADIRGFTSLSEQVDIRTLTKLMNRWFHNVSNAIFDNAGTVDK
ncbi:MAG: FHA domain-containing protein, partial [Thiohalophilus sp.]|uniref:FHA domain-containing protein n=1 Tax=Thiohalophilus sp. TaxID=3028392 RepID=UPI00286FE237